MRIFISKVTSRQAAEAKIPDELRLWLTNQLKTPGIECRAQEFLVNDGTNTLVKVAKEIKSCEIVIQIIDPEFGATPPKEYVRELLRSEDFKEQFEVRFPMLFSKSLVDSLTYTQWEAWIGVFFAKQVLPFVYKAPSAKIDRHESSKDGISIDLHLKLLRPYAGYHLTFSDRDELLKKIQQFLLGELTKKTIEQDSNLRKGEKEIEKKLRQDKLLHNLPLVVGCLLCLFVVGSVLIWSVLNKPNSDRSELPQVAERAKQGPLLSNGLLEVNLELQGTTVGDVRKILLNLNVDELREVGKDSSISDADLQRFVEVYLATEQDGQASIRAISKQEKTSWRDNNASKVLEQSKASQNRFVKGLAEEFQNEPETLSKILKGIANVEQ